MKKKSIVIFLFIVLIAVLPACETIQASQDNKEETEAVSQELEDDNPERLASLAAEAADELPAFRMVTVPGSNYYHDLEEDEPGTGFINPIQYLIAAPFEIGETEVTYELWYAVRIWAEDNGYRFQNEGCEGSQGTAGAEPTDAKLEPVTCVCWKDCVVWLNALCEMTGKEPVYRGGNGAVHRDATGSSEEVFTADNVIEAKTGGYRLPTSTEWEIAARYIDGTNWTYYQNASGSSENTSNREVTLEYAVFNADKTAAVATKKPNALGIYDMSGNVEEWCSNEDYDAEYAEYCSQEDSLRCRIYCGGSWDSSDPYGYQWVRVRPDAPAAQSQEENYNYLGFRIARSLPSTHEQTDMPSFHMKSVPAGTYTMQEEVGTTTVDGGFEIGETEVTYELWYAVRVWAESNGYRFQNAGMEGSGGIIGAAPTDAKLKPVVNISYLDCMIWLNALSEQNGKVSVYQTEKGEVLRDSTNGNASIAGTVVTDHNGYRLPELSEWELAARYIDGVNWTPCNYAGGGNTDNAQEELSKVAVYHSDGTAIVASKKPNALGIYDMRGNVKEICSYREKQGNVPMGGCYDDFYESLMICITQDNDPDSWIDQKGDTFDIFTGFRFIS